MRIILVFSALILFTSAARAERPVLASCSSGSGASFMLSEEDEATTIELLGLPPRPFADAVIVLRPGRSPHWDARSRAEIDRSCGGDGEGTEETALFGGVQPKSGVWRAELGPVELVGCPAMVRQAFPGSPGALPAAMRQPRRLEFDIPFHPADLELTSSFEATGMGDVTWRSIGPNSWEAEILADAFEDLPAFGDRRSSLVWRLTLVGEERIEHLATVTLAFPAELVAVLGAGADQCQAVTRNAWVRVGE